MVLYGGWGTGIMALTNEDRNWIQEKFDELRDLIIANRVDIAVLKVKAGIFGIIGGSIPVLITLAIYWMMKRGA